jgi:hypothetical protein
LASESPVSHADSLFGEEVASHFFISSSSAEASIKDEATKTTHYTRITYVVVSFCYKAHFRNQRNRALSWSLITHGNMKENKRNFCEFNVNESVLLNNILIYIQQDAMLHSLFYLETALHVSGGTTTHYQERKQLYLHHLVFVTPLLLTATVVE